MRCDDVWYQLDRRRDVRGMLDLKRNDRLYQLDAKCDVIGVYWLEVRRDAGGIDYM